MSVADGKNCPRQVSPRITRQRETFQPEELEKPLSPVVGVAICRLKGSVYQAGDRFYVAPIALIKGRDLLPENAQKS